ncbi:hypothetical protein JW890_08650 [candidate division WOR-3 bacterium]|nr:hypothetical protein [candidate division WOR-3 bacterium]
MKNLKKRDLRNSLRFSAAAVIIAGAVIFSLSFAEGYPGHKKSVLILVSMGLSFFVLFLKFPKNTAPKHGIISLFTVLLFCVLLTGLFSKSLFAVAFSLSLIASSLLHLTLVFPVEKKIYKKSGFAVVKVIYIYAGAAFVLYLLTAFFAVKKSEMAYIAVLAAVTLMTWIILVISTAIEGRKTKNRIIKRKTEHFMIGASLSAIFIPIFLTLFAGVFLPVVLLPVSFFMLEDFFPKVKEMPSRKLSALLISFSLSSLIFFVFSILPVLYFYGGRTNIFLSGMLGSVIFLFFFKRTYIILMSILYKNPGKRLQVLRNFEKISGSSEIAEEFSSDLSKALMKALSCSSCCFFIRKESSIFESIFGSESLCPIKETFDGERKDGIVNFVESYGKIIQLDEESSAGFKNVCIEDMLSISKIGASIIIPFFSGYNLIAFAMLGSPEVPLENSFIKELMIFSDRVSGSLASLIKIGIIEKNKEAENYMSSKRFVITRLKKTAFKKVICRKIEGDFAGDNAAFFLEKENCLYSGLIKWERDLEDWHKLSNLPVLPHVIDNISKDGLNSLMSFLTELKITESLLLVSRENDIKIFSEKLKSSYLISDDKAEKFEGELTDGAKWLFAGTSDIMELKNIRYEKLGEKRLKEILVSSPRMSFEEFANSVYSTLKEWSFDSAGLTDTEMLFVDLT